MIIEEIFSKKFQQIDAEQIFKSLTSKGYFYFESAMSENFVETISREFSSNDISLNNNYLSGVHTKTQYYNTNILAISKTFFKFCTSDLVFSISEKFLNSTNIRLKALRYYETYSSNNMKWHTDTKTSEKFSNIKGLIFIIYISDVYDGEFQYINGSHKYSVDYGKNDFSDSEISNLYSTKKIKSFKGKKGSIIIYNTAGIHRAKPSEKLFHCRKSLFFQIDDSENSEKILINPSFLSDADYKILNYLGFGKKNTYSTFPDTSISDLPFKKLILHVIFPWIIGQPKKLLKKYLSNDLKIKLKSLFSDD